MQECDIAEDIGIAFGYNNIPKVIPNTNTNLHLGISKYLPLNKFADLIRFELACAGYIECLTMSLLSLKENYNMLRKDNDLLECVQISNPKTTDSEVVRTSLIPGLLKTFQSNYKESVNLFYYHFNNI